MQEKPDGKRRSGEERQDEAVAGAPPPAWQEKRATVLASPSPMMVMLRHTLPPPPASHSLSHPHHDGGTSGASSTASPSPLLAPFCWPSTSAIHITYEKKEEEEAAEEEGEGFGKGGVPVRFPFPPHHSRVHTTTTTTSTSSPPLPWNRLRGPHLPAFRSIPCKGEGRKDAARGWTSTTTTEEEKDERFQRRRWQNCPPPSSSPQTSFTLFAERLQGAARLLHAMTCPPSAMFSHPVSASSSFSWFRLDVPSGKRRSGGGGGLWGVQEISPDTIPPTISSSLPVPRRTSPFCLPDCVSKEAVEEEENHTHAEAKDPPSPTRTRPSGGDTWGGLEMTAVQQVQVFRHQMQQWIATQLAEATRIRKTLPAALLFSQEQMQRRPAASLRPSSLDGQDADEDITEEEDDEEEAERGGSLGVRHRHTLSELSSLTSASHSQQPISFVSLVSSSMEWSAGRRSSVSTLRHRQKRREEQQERRERWRSEAEAQGWMEWDESTGRDRRRSTRSEEEEEDEEEERRTEEDAEDGPYARTLPRNSEMTMTYFEEMEREVEHYATGIAARGAAHPSLAAPPSVLHAASSTAFAGPLSTTEEEEEENRPPSTTTRTLTIPHERPASSRNSVLRTLRASDGRVLCGDVVPWTIWQWAYRWATLQETPLPQQGIEKE